MNNGCNVKIFTKCQLQENSKYSVTKELIFYNLQEDTLFYDNIELNLSQWNRGVLDKAILDSAKILNETDFKRMTFKVVKDKTGFYDYFYFKNGQYNDMLIRTDYFIYSSLFGEI